jgi:hypothetical protein
VFSVGASQRLCDEGLKRLRIEMRKSLERAVEDDGEERT